MSIFGPSPRRAVVSILAQFPIVRQKDEQAHGCYRTKKHTLKIYDAMLAAHCSGKPYQTRFDPPPADAWCCHPLREPKVGCIYGY